MGLWKKIRGIIGIPDWTSGSTKSLVIDDNGTLSKKTINGVPAGTTDLASLSWDSSSSSWVERLKVWILDDRIFMFNSGTNPGDMLTLRGDTGFVSANLNMERSNGGQYVVMRDGLGNFDFLFSTWGAEFYEELIMRDNKGILFAETASGGSSVQIKGPTSLAASVTFTLPNADGTADQVLKTDGSGNLGWADAGGGFYDGFVMLSTDESVTGTTWADIGFSLSLDASSTYLMKIVMFQDTNSVSGFLPSFRFQYSGTVDYGGCTLNGNSWSDITAAGYGAAPRAKGNLIAITVMVVTTTAGDFEMQHSSTVAGKTTYARKGSILYYKKII